MLDDVTSRIQPLSGCERGLILNTAVYSESIDQSECRISHRLRIIHNTPDNLSDILSSLNVFVIYFSMLLILKLI